MKREENVRSRSNAFSQAVECFYLETRNGLFFSVKGLEHPPDRTIGVLRYAPDPVKGDRKKEGKTYRRLYRFDEQELLIRNTFPQYLKYDPVFQTTLQSVPKSMIRRIYDPRRRLQELASAPAESAIEQDAFTLLALLQEKADVPASALGITGSLLIGLHTKGSDLDVVAFGKENCQKVHQALRGMLDDPHGEELSTLDARGMEDLFAQRAMDTRMEFHEFIRMEKRKVNQGRFRKRTYFIRFVKEAHEADSVYGQRIYMPLGKARIEALIADDGDSIFTPCTYRLSKARILDGPEVPDIREIISFRGRFCEQARKGEIVSAAGMLERVENSQGIVHYRLLLGNSPEDTLKSLNL
jgi:predicted nucleotidyltransferase